MGKNYLPVATLNRDAGVRKCLGYCGKPFWSLGKENRICKRCQGKQPRAAARDLQTPLSLEVAR